MNTEAASITTLLQELKKGDKVKISHVRKGTFIAELQQDNDPESEWLDIITLDEVEGQVNKWEPGDAIPCRKSLIFKIEKL